MSEEREPDPTCQVCGRRLLAGERPTDYVTREGASAVVCELCKPRAEAAGWLRPEEAEAARATGAGRERGRPRGQMLGGLLSRLPAGAGGGEEGAPASQEGPTEGRRPGGRRRPPEVGSRQETETPAHAGHVEPVGAPMPVAAEGEQGATLADAIRAFNSSNHRRTVAGLTRTLDAPRASGLAIRAASGLPGVRLTVAWELTWYQWEVSEGDAGAEVRESGKGETIDQLRAEDRAWNLMVDTDGTLEQRAAGTAAT